MGLRFDPMGGGQFKAALKQIMEVEAQPIKQMEARKAREEAKLKLFQEFKGKFAGIERAISEISTFRKFRELKADLGEGASLVNVTLDKDRAMPGVHDIEVRELAAKTSVISNGFEDADDPVLGLGFIVMNLGNGESAEIFVDEKNSSLRGIAGLINSQPNSPIRAAVVKDSTDTDAPWKIIFSAKKEGQVNSIDFPEFYFLDGSRDFYVDANHDAKNALVFFDGFPIELESNDVTDFLPGVNMHLKQAKPGQTFSLTITEDYQKITGKVKTLVDQVNQILAFITKQNQIDQGSDTRSTFAGDSSLQTIEYRLRNIMHEGFPVADETSETGYRVVHMNELGVEFDKTGQLGFKEDKFTKMMEKDFDGIAEAISGDMGFAFQLRGLMNGYTQVGTGLLSVREQGLKNRIKEIDGQIEAKAKILERRNASLTDQFSRLQGSLSQMQRQQQALSATMGGGGGGSIAQLLGG